MADEYNDEQADKDFEAGFDETPPAKLETPKDDKPAAEAPAPEAPAAEQPAPPAKAADAPPPAPEPDTVTLTKDQFARLTASADKTDALETRMATIFGTMGNIKQVVERLQAEAPKGAAIDLPEDLVTEMAEDYPELAGHIRKSFEKALKGVRGTGTAPPAEIDPEKVMSLVERRVIQHEVEALQDEHPKWREIVGVVDDKGNVDAANPFRQWLAKQPVEYQTKINSTNSSGIISKAIDKFQADTKKTVVPLKTPAADAARRDRIKNAVQPKGDGGKPEPNNTAEDEFAEGFRTG